MLNKIILALALSTAAILPAAANTPDDQRYAKENMERYMPDVRPAARNRGVERQFFLQNRTPSRRNDLPQRQESAPGFGG